MKIKLQYIDLDYLNELFNEDKSLINKIIECFIDYSPATLEDLMAFKVHHDFDQLDFHLYKYRHQVKVVGAHEIVRLLDNIIVIKDKKTKNKSDEIIRLLDKVEELSHKAINESKNLHLQLVA